MRTVVPIVEGDGEVEAVPVLLRRLVQRDASPLPVNIAKPLRVPREKLLNREGELHRTALLAKSKAGPQGAVLLILDADDDCPAEHGPILAARLTGLLGGGVRSAVVLANREFEAWFIAAADSLVGVRGFVPPPSRPDDPDRPRDAKGWLRENMPRRAYKPLLHQAAFAARFDIDEAAVHSRSFRHLLTAWQRLVAP